MSARRAAAPRTAVRRTGIRLAVVALGMFAFGYALVPLYDVLCEITGLNGKTGRAEATAVSAPDPSRWVTVEFTGSSQRGLPWEFRPRQASMRVHPGEIAVAYYEVHNGAGEAITGQAVPSVAPNRAAAHFKKIECFCFTEQRLAARETREMPVRFVVGTDLPKDVHTVTLSYAFFNSDKASAERYGGTAPAADHDHSQHAGHAGG